MMSTKKGNNLMNKKNKINKLYIKKWRNYSKRKGENKNPHKLHI